MPLTKNYVSIVIFKSETPDRPQDTLYDETIVLIDAENDNEALKKVTDYAKSCETNYLNANGHLRNVSFFKIVDINIVLQTEPSNGVAEIYSRHFKNIKSYLRFDPLTYTINPVEN